MEFSKLCLGTVQFGIPYGINNMSGIPSDEAVNSIFKIATQNQINILDTAHGYGNAESRIGQCGLKDFKIVTKFTLVKNEVDLKSELTDSLSKLNTKSAYGYMAHNANTLINNPNLWETLLEAKENKLIEKIGYSLYSTQQLEKLLELSLTPDLVQLPYSLLDRKFEPFLSQLKKSGTEIHVRSVFLQGLYFMDIFNLPSKLEPLRSNLKELQDCCKEYNVSIGSLALNFALSNPLIDKVVIGVDIPSQLEQNIDFIKSWKPNQQLIARLNNIEVTNKELLNPANWN